MSIIEKAKLFADGAENARQVGDLAASLELVIVAAQLLQLARLLK